MFSRITSRRPSPSLIVACMALVLALAGGAIAAPNAAKISKSKVKKIAAKEIDKAAPGLSVAKATNADNAANATNATNATNAQSAAAVDGQSIAKVNYRADAGTGAQTILDAGGLTLSAACAAGINVTVTAATSKADSSIYSFVARDADPGNPLEADLESGQFDPGANFDLLAAGTGNINLVHFEYDAQDGTIATGTLAVDEDGITTNKCVVTGNVIVG